MVAPYAWATALDGSSTVKGRTTDVDASFIDILDHTQFPKGLFGVAAFAEARNGRIAILADVLYAKFVLGGGITRSRSVDALNASVGASAGLKIEMVIAEVAAAYEIARWPAPGTTGTALDLYGGVRIWWQRAELSLDLSGTVNVGDLTRTADRTFAANGDVSWVDPVIGMRVRHQLSPQLDLSISGDIGGFGAGSKFSWQALGLVSYEFARGSDVSWSAMLGYKALSVDYAQGSGLNQYVFDMVIHGPILGVVARF